MLLKETNKIMEGLLFMKGEEGVSIDFFSSFMDIENTEAENMLNVFLEEYNKKESAVLIKKFGTTYKMLLNQEISSTIKKALVTKNLIKLSKASLEALAIIAYNQPITKVHIDKIRGVSSESIVQSLLNKELIVSNKTLDTLGKPKLYETTETFLDVFGLESLEQLPKSELVSNDEINKFLNN